MQKKPQQQPQKSIHLFFGGDGEPVAWQWLWLQPCSFISKHTKFYTYLCVCMSEQKWTFSLSGKGQNQWTLRKQKAGRVNSCGEADTLGHKCLLIGLTQRNRKFSLNGMKGGDLGLVVKLGVVTSQNWRQGHCLLEDYISKGWLPDQPKQLQLWVEKKKKNYQEVS